jgi:hypothetical protein
VGVSSPSPPPTPCIWKRVWTLLALHSMSPVTPALPCRVQPCLQQSTASRLPAGEASLAEAVSAPQTLDDIQSPICTPKIWVNHGRVRPKTYDLTRERNRRRLEASPLGIDGVLHEHEPCSPG